VCFLNFFFSPSPGICGEGMGEGLFPLSPVLRGEAG